MERPRCGALTKAGTPCRIAAGDCDYHQPNAAGIAPTPPRHSANVLPPPLEAQDERAAAWWTIGEVVAERLSTSQGSVIATLLRILHAFGPSPASEDDILAEAEFRGRLMHGLPPRTEAEWAKAERVFDAQTVAEFRRWERLLERDGGDVTEPQLLVEPAARQRDVP